MKIAWKKHATWLLWLVPGLAATLLFLWPQAVEVETATLRRGPLRVTIDEDGRTRVRDRYTVSAPLEGELLRVAVRAGDALVAGRTRLATLLPKSPDLLDARVLAQAEARAHSAEAAWKQSERRVAESQEALELAKHQFERARGLLASRTITSEEYETMEHRERLAAETRRAAEFGQQVARFEWDWARAALAHFQPPGPQSPGKVDATAKPVTPTATKPESTSEPVSGSETAGQLDILSPIDGRVFRVVRESAGLVPGGTPLLEIGDPRDLEIEVDVLSSDAVRIPPGAKMFLEQWGGAEPLEARVRLVEPSGFTKVSALGVEEQRVNVIADFLAAPENRPRLGDGYRVEARIVEWESDEVLIVPAGALFRDGDHWAVFAVESSRARLRRVRIGHHNGREAELLEGLAAGASVVQYPGDLLSDGTRVRQRSR
ncbi:MAG: efflux RND transporter periplasmic adaptor subunit [Planctomycetota bacterium]